MSLRLTGAVALAVALPAAASTATIRIEGGSGNVLPETAVVVPGSPTAQVAVRDTTDPDTVTVARRSATAQLARASTSFGLPFGFDVFDFGTGPSALVTRIGADKMPPSFSPSWRLKVNHRAADAGADTTLLKAGDRVLWSFGANFEALELDLRLSRRVVTAGQSLGARVVSFDNAGVASPARAARVWFAGTTVRAGADGRATLRASNPGAYWASATLPGTVRSQRSLVCVQSAGRVEPCSAVAFPKQNARTGRVGAIVGVVGAPSTRVQVSLARIVGSQCRFLDRDRRTFTDPGDCRDRIAIPVSVDTARSWTLSIVPRPGNIDGIGPGRYRVWSRQALGARIESRPTPGMNTVTFTVTGG